MDGFSSVFPVFCILSRPAPWVGGGGELFPSDQISTGLVALAPPVSPALQGPCPLPLSSHWTALQCPPMFSENPKGCPAARS